MHSSSSHLCAAAPGGGVFPVSAFSAFHLLRNYNYLLTPQVPEQQKPLSLKRLTSDCPLRSPESRDLSPENAFLNLPQNPALSHNLFGYPHPAHLLQQDNLSNRNGTLLSPCGSLISQNYRRLRGEKKPIPDEQKDDKYFERRRRNNQAAKKSRDARKLREDQIALRATLLEHENAILKAQVLTLREETSSLRQMLLQKKTLELTATPVS